MVTLMIGVINVGHGCWRQNVLVTSLLICHHHKINNITLSPASLSPDDMVMLTSEIWSQIFDVGDRFLWDCWDVDKRLIWLIINMSPISVTDTHVIFSAPTIWAFRAQMPKCLKMTPKMSKILGHGNHVNSLTFLNRCSDIFACGSIFFQFRINNKKWTSFNEEI